MMRIIVIPMLVLFFAGGALAMSHGDAREVGRAHGVGVLNAIDADSRKVNISHGPIPALKWPGMKMDLPVTGSVDLAAFEAGQKVQFTVVKGEDHVFRISAMCVTESDEAKEGLCTAEDGGAHGQ